MLKKSNEVKWSIILLITFFLFSSIKMFSQTGITGIGSFEGELPSYWTIGADPSGSTLEWATDQSRSMGKSLKITKEATDEAAMWTSENMADFWAPVHNKDQDIFIGAYVRTEGVNTNPASDDAKWYISYAFYDSVGTLIGETKLDIDQSASSSGGWVADTNAVGQTILPRDSWTTIIKFVGGKDATGTVWADDFMLYGREGWAGQNWNTAVGVPSGWLYWLPPSGGNDGEITKGYENTVVTSEEAHTGLNSLKFDLPFDREPGDGFVGTRRMLLDGSGGNLTNSRAMDISALSVNQGDIIRISVWVKASNLVPDSAAMYPTTWAAGFTYGFWKGNGNNDGFNSLDGYPIDMQFVFPDVTSFDWTQYYIDVAVPDDADAKALSVRLHPYARFTGTLYFDDLQVEVLDMPNIAGIGSFEGELPSYWTIGADPSGSTLEWATDQSRNMGKSLKITKEATDEAAMWTSENMADFWAPVHNKDQDIFIGAYVRTEGVNTNPASDDAKWYISYTFYDSVGTLIGETKLDIDQSASSSGGWVADTNAVGQTILPRDSWTTIIKFVGGKDAVGTVWADDFMLYGREGWAGQNWNTAVGVPSGWFYWLPPSGGNDGKLTKGYENTEVTTEEAHSGLNSLKFDLPFDRESGDAFVGTRRMLLDGSGGNIPNSREMDISALSVNQGDIIRISVWVKASNLVPDSAAMYPTTWAAGFTYGFWKGNGNNDGWNSLDGYPIDMQFVFPEVTSFDWTQYYIDIAVPDDADAKALSVRLHPYARFTGTLYFDDLMVEVVGVTDVNSDDQLPNQFLVFQNYPNPFNPSTTISYTLPRTSMVSVKIYDVLGREVISLLSEVQNRGVYNVVWNGTNNNGAKVGSGIYFYRVETDKFAQVMKMILLK